MGGDWGWEVCGRVWGSNRRLIYFILVVIYQKSSWVSLNPGLLGYKGLDRSLLHYGGLSGLSRYPLPSYYMNLSRFFLLQVTETQLRLPEHARGFAAHVTAQPGTELVWQNSGIQSLFLSALPSSSPWICFSLLCSFLYVVFILYHPGGLPTMW